MMSSEALCSDTEYGVAPSVITRRFYFDLFAGEVLYTQSPAIDTDNGAQVKHALVVVSRCELGSCEE